jgi:putative sigma-54 modulation protein
MERQIRRFRDKQVFQRRRQKARTQSAIAQPILPAAAPDLGIEATDDEAPLDTLVRRKRFKLLPMDEDEAIEQMELLGHDFFVFFNPEEAQINVIYRRRDGQYGLILPELA